MAEAKEKETTSVKATVLAWIFKSMSFPMLLLCLLGGIGITILILPYIGPLDDQLMSCVIVINSALVLLIINGGMSLFKNKTKGD